MKKITFMSIISFCMYLSLWGGSEETTLPFMLIALPEQKQTATYDMLKNYTDQYTHAASGSYQDALYQQAFIAKFAELMELSKKIAQLKAQRFTQKYLLPVMDQLNRQFQEYYTTELDKATQEQAVNKNELSAQDLMVDTSTTNPVTQDTEEVD